MPFYEMVMSEIERYGKEAEIVAHPDGKRLHHHREGGTFRTLQVEGVNFIVRLAYRNKRWWTWVESDCVAHGRKDLGAAVVQTANFIMKSLPARMAVENETSAERARIERAGTVRERLWKAGLQGRSPTGARDTVVVDFGGNVEVPLDVTDEAITEAKALVDTFDAGIKAWQKKHNRKE